MRLGEFSDRRLRPPAETRLIASRRLIESETGPQEPERDAAEAEEDGPDELDPTTDEAIWRDVDERFLDAFDDERPEPGPGDFDWPRDEQEES